MGTALLTDHYELTMVASALRDGTAERRAVFEAWTRSTSRGWGVVAGTDQAIDDILAFPPTADEIEWLARAVGAEAAEWFEGFRFSGDVWSYLDGDAYFADSPVLRTEATLAECLVLETVVLSALNWGCAHATAAAELRLAAGEAAVLIEMGARRTHADAAVDAARHGWVGGLDSSSNLAAGRRYGVPTGGTAAHAWTLAHPFEGGERAAFDAQIEALGVGTTLLVDTFDVDAAIRTAVEAARAVGEAGPGAIRLDSGDLAEQAVAARELLDELGATGTKIVVSGDLDAERILAIRRSDAPVDGYGIGTSFVATPPAGFIYKLVEMEDPSGDMVPVAKESADPEKATPAGTKAVRRIEDDGAVRDVVRADPAELPEGRDPQILRIAQGERVGEADPVALTRVARDRAAHTVEVMARADGIEEAS